MKAYFLIVCILSIGLVKAQDFEIIKATSQKWTGGTARSGYGTNYKLTLVCKKKIKKLKFDKLCIGKEAFPVKVVKNSQKELSLSKNDTLFLTARKRIKTDEYGIAIKEDKKVEKCPVKFESEALLIYKLKRKENYINIDKIKKLKAIFYP